MSTTIFEPHDKSNIINIYVCTSKLRATQTENLKQCHTFPVTCYPVKHKRTDKPCLSRLRSNQFTILTVDPYLRQDESRPLDKMGQDFLIYLTAVARPSSIVLLVNTAKVLFHTRHIDSFPTSHFSVPKDRQFNCCYVCAAIKISKERQTFLFEIFIL